MTKLTDKLASSLLPIVFGAAMIAAGLWIFEPDDTSRICAKGSCSSGVAVSLSVILFGSIFTLLGLSKLVSPLLRRTIKPASRPPYGSMKERAEKLRNMGVSEEQAKIELGKYRS